MWWTQGRARALSDGVFKALVFDVIVALGQRGGGVSRLLMEALLGHPKVAAARHVELYCLPHLMSRYGRWQFTDQVGAIRLVRRTSA